VFNTTRYEQTRLSTSLRLTKHARFISNILSLILAMLLTNDDETDLTSEKLVLAEWFGECIPQLITRSNELPHD
jgi:hypothetical protein